MTIPFVQQTQTICRYHEEQFCETILNLDHWFRRNCPSKVYLIWISGSPFVQHSVTICANLLEGTILWGSILWNYFEFGSVVQEQMLFKKFIIWSSGNPPVQLCNFERGHYGEHSCEVMWNLDQWFRRRCCLKTFLIWSSGSPFATRSGTICAVGRGYLEEQFCEIILNLDQCFRRRCILKIFLIWSSGGPYVQQSRTICAILVEGIMRNNSVQ